MTKISFVYFGFVWSCGDLWSDNKPKKTMDRFERNRFRCCCLRLLCHRPWIYRQYIRQFACKLLNVFDDAFFYDVDMQNESTCFYFGSISCYHSTHCNGCGNHFIWLRDILLFLRTPGRLHLKFLFVVVGGGFCVIYGLIQNVSFTYAKVLPLSIG